MKRLWSIVPAVMLGIGVATAGAFTRADSMDKAGINISYMSFFSKDAGQIDEKPNTSVVSAQTGGQNYFIDSNGDGVCDNYADGICPQNGTGNGYHCGNGNYTDNNNDGICDNYADGVCPQNGTGSGYHCGNGNYTDNNNDGICDNYADGICPQNGTGNGYRRGSGCGCKRTGA